MKPGDAQIIQEWIDQSRKVMTDDLAAKFAEIADEVANQTKEQVEREMSTGSNTIEVSSDTLMTRFGARAASMVNSLNAHAKDPTVDNEAIIETAERIFAWVTDGVTFDEDEAEDARTSVHPVEVTGGDLGVFRRRDQPGRGGQ